MGKVQSDHLIHRSWLCARDGQQNGCVRGAPYLTYCGEVSVVPQNPRRISLVVQVYARLREMFGLVTGRIRRGKENIEKGCVMVVS